MAKKIDVSCVPTKVGSGYPAEFAQQCANRVRQRLGEAADLTDFGVNLLRLPPGAWSSQRHFHTAEEEFVYVLAGEVMLVTDAGAELLTVGDCAGFKARVSDGHHLQNRSSADVLLLEVGSRRLHEDVAEYPDIDLRSLENDRGYVHKDGTPYPSD